MDIVKSGPFWAILLAHMGYNYGYETLMTELPTYMKQVLHFSIKDVRKFTYITLLFWTLLLFNRQGFVFSFRTVFCQRYPTWRCGCSRSSWAKWPIGCWPGRISRPLWLGNYWTELVSQYKFRCKMSTLLASLEMSTLFTYSPRAIKHSINGVKSLTQI